MKNIAVSIGDLNGIGIEIALKAHKEISKICNPIYCINEKLLKQAANLLQMDIPKDFKIFQTQGEFEINPGKIDRKSGLYSFLSFIDTINLAKNKEVDAIVTLPINKESWMQAKLKYKGHTEVLRDIFKKDAIMMLGSKKLYVALFTEHIPLKDVHKKVKKENLIKFFENFYNEVKADEIYVLSLNPHAGDGGTLGKEEIKEIIPAIKEINKKLNKQIFKGPLVPDTAFVNHKKYYIAMYHDQGLIPLKTLYFDESINVSLNLPIIRTSVDHGTAFDIAYQNKAKTKSYINAVKYAIDLANKK